MIQSPASSLTKSPLLLAISSPLLVYTLAWDDTVPSQHPFMIGISGKKLIAPGVVNVWNDEHLFTCNDLESWALPLYFPAVDSNRLAGRLTCGDEGLYDFLHRSRWLDPLEEMLCSAGSTSLTLSPVSNCCVEATSCPSLSDTRSVFKAVNEWKSSSHCVLFMSSGRDW